MTAENRQKLAQGQQELEAAVQRSMEFKGALEAGELELDDELGCAPSCLGLFGGMMTNKELSADRSPVPRFLLLLLAVLIVWSLYQGWGRWSDPQIDFGRELYVPWRLTQGDLLYQDIAYFNGPLSPYFNAFVFKLMGVGYWKLVAANALVLVGFCMLLWRVLKNRPASRQRQLGACRLPAFCERGLFLWPAGPLRELQLSSAPTAMKPPMACC